MRAQIHHLQLTQRLQSIDLAMEPKRKLIHKGVVDIDILISSDKANQLLFQTILILLRAEISEGIQGIKPFQGFESLGLALWGLRMFVSLDHESH